MPAPQRELLKEWENLEYGSVGSTEWAFCFLLTLSALFEEMAVMDSAVAEKQLGLWLSGDKSPQFWDVIEWKGNRGNTGTGMCNSGGVGQIFKSPKRWSSRSYSTRDFRLVLVVSCSLTLEGKLPPELSEPREGCFQSVVGLCHGLQWWICCLHVQGINLMFPLTSWLFSDCRQS